MVRLPRNKRVKNPPNMRLTARDVEIIKTVHDCRVLRGDQLQALFFGCQSTASYRLLRLYQHGYLDRQFLPTLGGIAASPTLYTVGKQGIGVLHRQCGYEPEDVRKRLGKKELTPLFLEHVLEINAVRAAVTMAIRSKPYELLMWLDDAQLKATYAYVTIKDKHQQRREVSLIPDGYFRLKVPQGRASFFLELDRGKMTVGRFQEKILAYQAHVASGQYEARYDTRSLRVLTVTSGPKRLQNLKRTTEEVGRGQMFWFCLIDDIQPESVLNAPIWQVAGHPECLPLIES